MRRRILVIPALHDLDSFGRLAAHLGHYFSHIDPARISVLVDAGLLADAKAWLASPQLPEGFDRGVLDRIAAVRDRIALVSWPRDLESLRLSSELVLDWNVGVTKEDPWASIRTGRRPERTLFDIDWRGVRLGAASIAQAARLLGQGHKFDKEQLPGFLALLDRIGDAERAYLLGTGPSVRTALERDLSDGVRIACNTFILDDELMEHVRPQVLTFADPIFHFGPSTYAQSFQRALVERARRFDFSIVTTERYAPLLRGHLPELGDRVFGLRQGSANWADNFDLRRHAAVHPYPNVLTMLMLPLASTVARSIGLIGFDGRNPDESYFWKHGSTVQFDEELSDIRLVHPGFFEIDYTDYYGEHTATVERMFSLIEERGTEVRALAPSFIPALRRRSPISVTCARARLVSLSPDWIGDYGHFGPFERRVHRAAAAAGEKHLTLTSAGLPAAADWQIPAFSEATFLNTAASHYAPVGERFEGELRAALDGLDLEPGAVVFFYTADVWHLAGLLAIAAERPDLRFVANLMRSHIWLDAAREESDPVAQWRVDLLRAGMAAASGTNLTIAVDTPALARETEKMTGHLPPTWPMIALNERSPDPADRGDMSGPVHVVAPIQGQAAKGFPDLLDLVDRLDGRLERGELTLTTRWPAPGRHPDLLRVAESLEERGVRLIRDDLSDEAFADLIGSADIALIPYRLKPFRTRTSGLTLDSLLAGKPVVAVRGTWGGELVERYGAGLTYAESDAAEMESALSRVITRLSSYRSRVAGIRDVIREDFAPERLLEFLDTIAGTPARAPDAAAVGRVRELDEQLREQHRWYAVTHAAARIDAAVREDDNRRVSDHLRDDVDRLRRAVGDQKRGPASGRRLSRRDALVRTARGTLGPVLMLAVLLFIVAAILAIVDSPQPSILALAAAGLASVLALVIVAVRLQRRT